MLFVDEERYERIRTALGELASLSTIIVMSEDRSSPAPLGDAPEGVRVELSLIHI